MTERQSQFLKQLIDTHVITGEPIASALLAETNNISSATVRNDLACLEEDGYIVQPHTSSGRVPSEKGYKYYVANYLKIQQATETTIKKLNSVKADIKSLAKELAEQSGLAVLVALEKNNYYYTGLSKLFSQTEFQQHNEIINISTVLDKLEETLHELYETLNGDITILIGSENPFSPTCSLLATEMKAYENQTSVFAILGPMRMDYNNNASLLNYVKTNINK